LNCQESLRRPGTRKSGTAVSSAGLACCAACRSHALHTVTWPPRPARFRCPGSAWHRITPFSLQAAAATQARRPTVIAQILPSRISRPSRPIGRTRNRCRTSEERDQSPGCIGAVFPASCPRPSHPARERAGLCPPPKAQPAPGNAQATGTAPGYRDLWKAGWHPCPPHRRSKAPQAAESLRYRDRGGSFAAGIRRRSGPVRGARR